MKPSITNPLLSAALLLAAIMPSSAADLTWDSGNTANGANIDPGDGNWNTTAGNIVWNNAGTNVVWSATNVAIFGGADGTYAITTDASFSAQNILFANSGYTLSAGTAQTITVTSGGQPGIRVISGKTATIGANVTVTEDNGTMLIGAPNGASGGTLNIEGTVRSGGTGSTVIDGVGTIVNVKTGGILRAAGTSGGSLAVGQLANSDNSLNVQGGSVLVERSGQSFLVGNQGQATVTLTSGNITIAAHATSGGVVFSGDANNDTKSNTFHLNGGFLTTSMVRKGSGDSTATFNFNGGTLTTNGSNTSFMTGLNAANVKAGGAKIDTQAFNITIAQDLLNDGAGGLTKSGSGTLTLAGANTYVGATNINTGTLAIGSSGSIANSSQIIMGANTTLDVSAVSFTLGGSNAQTLSGTGTITGNMTAGANGTLAIGSSPGTMSFANNLGLNAGSISNFEINGFTLGNYDLALATTLGTQTVAFNGGTLNLLFQSGFSTLGTVKIFDFDLYAGSGFTSVASTGLASGYTASFDKLSGIVTVIPEPRAALLGGLGLLALLRRRRA